VIRTTTIIKTKPMVTVKVGYRLMCTTDTVCCDYCS